MAGKGFTVNKDWDNPIDHAMPEQARVAAEVRIGSVAVRPATVLAPMAGVTDTVFRRFIRHSSLFATSSKAQFSSPVPTSEGPGAPNLESETTVESAVIERAVGVRAADDRVHVG